MAQVTITVHDGSHNPVSGAVVDGTWSADASGPGSCTTDGGGTCTITSDLMPKKGTSSAIFTIDNVNPVIWNYTWVDNHDSDGDSSGTAIQVNKNGTTQDPIVTNQPPTASFSYTCSVQSCNYDASGSSDADGTIASYSWDFGDSSTGSGVNPSHTYATTGTYPVVLTVTDDGGVTDTHAQDVAVGLPSMHIGDLDANSSPGTSPAGKWDATVTIIVHDGGEGLISNATVSGSWSNGTSGTGSCMTDQAASVAAWRPLRLQTL